MVIDFHTHCFPQKIAEKAIDTLRFKSGGLIPQTDGTAEGLLSLMDKSGVDMSCVMNIATNPKQQKSVNDFAISINGERICSFGSVHPDSPDWEEELERIAEAGLKGIKLHPDYQGFFADDPKMKPIYKKISSLNLITLFHAGLDYGFAPPYHCCPENMARALLWFDSPVIAAHWGGLNLGEDVLCHLAGLPIYFDTSFGYGSMPKDMEKRLIDAHGCDKILFGSDCPWHDPAWEMTNLETMGLSDEELSEIYSGNALNLLGMRNGD